MAAHEKIDEMFVKIHEIRQVTGARWTSLIKQIVFHDDYRCLADGQSAAFIINTMNREEKMIKEEEEESIMADKARSDPVRDKEQIDKKSSSKNSPKRKITLSQTVRLNRYLQDFHFCYW